MGKANHHLSSPITMLTVDVVGNRNSWKVSRLALELDLLANGHHALSRISTGLP